MSELIPISTPLRVFEDHEKSVRAVAVFPNKRRMVTGSDDKTLRLWDLETGVVLKKMEGHSGGVKALAVSRDGQIIASGDENGEVIAWHGESGESITQPIKAHSEWISSVDFSPDGTVLATGSYDHTVKFWCTKTWQMQGDPIECGNVHCVRYSPSGELRIAIGTKKSIQIYNPGTRECVASLTGRTHAWTPDGTRLLSVDLNLIHEWDTSTWQQVSHPYQHADKIRTIAINPAGTLVASGSNLWLLSDRQTIAVFQYSYSCVTFSVDGKHILGGSWDNKISKWEVPKNANAKILTMTTFRNACLTEDLSTAEELFTQEIDTDPNDFISYAHRSFVMTRKHDCDDALRDAMKSISIQPSLTGYISKGIALCGKGHVREARIALDVASMFTNQDSKINHFLLLIKAIILFNADQHEEAMLLIKELAAACSNADLLACRVVEAYLCVQLGTKALDNARYDEAADHFTAAVNSGAFLSAFIDQTCQDLVVLFGWDLESLCLTAHQKRCQAFLSASKPDEALQAHQCMMNAIDESTKASCLDWSNEFKERCSALAEQNDRILGRFPGKVRMATIRNPISSMEGINILKFPGHNLSSVMGVSKDSGTL
ncbi:WD40-repeat-containing domain protein [Suillus bovinus]|uniref:WD40-repeat-containing domain protein n=1 Tax=Suillus bovinus TaxID=48563 RepID=UPI001B872408|nr:WD40-repeat-containing domain protein [Suillus bovinus]KAG2125183.1 WD40-repeat-containing domain protein [Suillus bovinus]